MIFNTVISGQSTPVYQGPYSVNSQLDTDLTLSTAGTILTQDITVKSVVITRTQNEYGGITISIEEDS